MSELDKYIDRGYVSSIEEMAYFLGVSGTKARGLLKNAPKIELNESLYHEYKQGFNTKVPRIYYNEKDVLIYLITENIVRVYYHDPRQAFTDNPINAEKRINNSYLLNDMFMTKLLFNISQSVIEIIIEENGYSFFSTEQHKGKLVDWYISKDNSLDLFNTNDNHVYENILKNKKDIYTKSDYVKYLNMIKRGFYIRFQVGKSDNRYIHSVNQLKESEQKDFITNWIKTKPMTNGKC